MLNLALNTYFHILMIIGVFTSIIVELVLISKEISWGTLKKLLRADMFYGITAILVVITGLLNWFVFGKGAAYYSNNTLFLTKFSLFIIVSLLSIYPTVIFARLKKKHKNDPPESFDIPNYKNVKTIIRLELAILLLLPLLATLMANGLDFTNL